MNGSLDWFERVVRSVAAQQTELPPAPNENLQGLELPESSEREEPHPFETRNIHPDLPTKVRTLFDDGHYDHAVFEAFKFIEKEVKRLSGIRGRTGYPLMMEAFNESNAKIRLNALVTDSEIDEQRGYKSIFAGASAGIRNPRGHEVDMVDTPDEALDYLALASLLLRRLDSAGLR